MLDKTEKDYFDSLCWEKINPIRERHEAEIQRINPLTNPGNSPAPYTHEIRQFKREIAEARIQAYIETYKKIGRYPDESEFEEFGNELFGTVDNKGNNLPKHFRGALSPYPLQLVERIEDQLSNEIRQDAAIALSALHHFINEGKLVALQQAQLKQQTDSFAPNERFNEFQEYLGRQCNTIGDLDWDKVKGFLERIPKELDRVDFLKQLAKLPDDGVKNSIVVNPAIHRRNQDAFLRPLQNECSQLLSQHFNLDAILHEAESIEDHGEALSYLWKVLREYTKYHPTIRSNQFQPEELRFCNGIKTEIQFRKDLQDSVAKRSTVSKGNIFNLQGANSRVNIDSQDNSVNISHNITENVFADIKYVIQSSVEDDEERTQILNKLNELEEAKGLSGFTQKYQEFIASAANHMTLLAPFIPALTQMLNS